MLDVLLDLREQRGLVVIAPVHSSESTSLSPNFLLRPVASSSGGFALVCESRGRGDVEGQQAM